MRDDSLHNQLIKLGDMMGDSMHHDDPWIAKEYAKVARQLYPEAYAGMAKRKNSDINQLVAAVLLQRKCKCSGELKQVRKGSWTCACTVCGARYKIKTKKKDDKS